MSWEALGCHWEALAGKTGINPPRTLPGFLLLTEDNETSLRIRACHLYAVRKAVLVRKAEGCRRDRLTVRGLIGAGHKTTMLADSSLRQAYMQASIAQARKKRKNPESCTGCGLDMFECNCIESCTGCWLDRRVVHLQNYVRLNALLFHNAAWRTGKKYLYILLSIHMAA